MQGYRRNISMTGILRKWNILEDPKMINETICVQESELSDIEILDQGKWPGSAIALVILLIALVGLIARGLFVYFLNYEAPKDRPINSLMFHEQVKYFLKSSDSM